MRCAIEIQEHNGQWFTVQEGEIAGAECAAAERLYRSATAPVRVVIRRGDSFFVLMQFPDDLAA